MLPFPPFPPLSLPPPLYTNLIPLRHSYAQPSGLQGFAKIGRLRLHFFLPTRYTTISILWPSFCDEQKTYLKPDDSLHCSLRHRSKGHLHRPSSLQGRSYYVPWPRFISQSGERHRPLTLMSIPLTSPLPLLFSKYQRSVVRKGTDWLHTLPKSSIWTLSTWT